MPQASHLCVVHGINTFKGLDGTFQVWWTPMRMLRSLISNRTGRFCAPGTCQIFFSRNDLERGGEYIEDFNQLFERIRWKISLAFCDSKKTFENQWHFEQWQHHLEVGNATLPPSLKSSNIPKHGPLAKVPPSKCSTFKNSISFHLRFWTRKIVHLWFITFQSTTCLEIIWTAHWHKISIGISRFLDNLGATGHGPKLPRLWKLWKSVPLHSKNRPRMKNDLLMRSRYPFQIFEFAWSFFYDLFCFGVNMFGLFFGLNFSFFKHTVQLNFTR